MRSFGDSGGAGGSSGAGSGGGGDFETFVAARGPRLLRVAWLLTGDAHLAEDLLQTVLAKVWPKWQRIATDSPEAYVRKALVHTHASWWRRRWRGEVPHGELPDAVGAADAYASVDLEQSLAAAVRALPVRQRAVVVLRYFEDLSVEETAATLGCAPGTVKSQSAKALRSLRASVPGMASDSDDAKEESIDGSYARSA
ncbi:SigE family RNA polymerase sigma factor [Streptomyces clavuligerus]|uniref:Sigma-70 n=1 Tax=Streptomyces clavuligerus TaxID=1901 RepID=B5GU85_STRCL|nr:SigE family RNA polymerase sigma factor [Streptomyces clavuligerus]ANW19164.1 RNA polymerase subunit sigma-24 [Streptomyces clavuligerus]AXU13748.1 SigE family RNA polymerase sigma factor [Streptomyces clavuligerus]EDY49881.1 conserved hypothetical protein [Streptomyces clavuligerus]EFG08085.1 Sigma-70 [Streptomyces clavuligerus]MBY6303724.1 SigE family RNA polymerase sigma factor [Streptomyces clavuligerus]